MGPRCFDRAVKVSANPNAQVAVKSNGTADIHA
jgi:hypothetical protein